MVSPFRLGELVISTAGRDKGKYYTVVKIVDSDYVQVADGDTRKLSRPKLKNKKHLKSTGIFSEEISIWLNENKRVRNEDIKWFIKNYEKNKEAN